MYVHMRNLKHKIASNYHKKGSELHKFYVDVYEDVHRQLLNIDFESDPDAFRLACIIVDQYLKEIDDFASFHGITSQSKFRSTFLEELSMYLFNGLPIIRDGILGVYSKNVYAGMKIDETFKVDLITKDVDFCIGKKVKLVLDNSSHEIIIPVVCVEVKTYLDGTMYGEVMFSSGIIKNASPTVKTYVLMEKNQVGSSKIFAARAKNEINEMFVLKGKNDKEVSPEVLLDYYNEIKISLENTTQETIPDIGRLLR